MKTVKKILSLMLVAAMLLSVMPGQWISAETAPQLIVGTASVDVSNGAATCVVPIKIQNNPGFNALQFNVQLPEGWSLITSDEKTYEDYYIKDQTTYSIFCTEVTKYGVTFPELLSSCLFNVGLENATFAITDQYGTAYTGNGDLMYLNISVPAGTANGQYPISINFGKDGSFSYTVNQTTKEYSEEIQLTSGSVTVTGGVDKLTENNTTVTMDSASYTYTGLAITPELVITYGGKTLEKDKDYTVSYKDNTQPGKATITIKGNGSYQGEITKTFTINKVEGKITGTETYTKTYGDADFTLDAVVNSDAALSYVSSDTNVATVDEKGKVTIQGAGDATITVSAPETVTHTAPTDLKVAVTVGIGAQNLQGATALALTYGEGDYTIKVIGYYGELSFESSNPNVATAYRDEQDGKIKVKMNGAGSATITVKAAAVPDKYTEASKEITVSVGRKALKVTGVLADDKEYDGKTSATVYATTAKIEGLVEGDDVVVNAEGTFETADAGVNKTVKLTLSLTGKDAANYRLDSDSQTTTTANITKKPVEVPTAVTELTYDGTEKTGVAATDLYTVENATATNAGTYTAKATLTDSTNYKWADENFDGTVSWSIATAAAKTLTEERNYRYNYSGSIPADAETVKQLLEDAGEVTVTKTELSDEIFSQSADGTIRFEDGLTAADAGKSGTITLNFSSTNYEASTLTIKVNVIDKNDVSDGMSFANGTVSYTGQKQTMETATYNGSGEGITYSYSKDPVNVGTYTVTAIYEDADNIGTATATLTIQPVEISVSSAKVSSKTYDGTTEATVTDVQFEGLVNHETLGEADYTVSNAAFDSANAGSGKSVTYSVTLAKTGTAANYVLTGTVPALTGTISRKAVTVTAKVNSAEYTFNGKAQEPVPAISAEGLVEGESLTQSDYTISYSNNINAGTAGVTVKSTSGSNYSFEASTEFTIKKAAAPTLTAPDMSMKYAATGTVTTTISGVPQNAGTVTYSVPDRGSWTGEESMVSSYAVEQGKVTLTLTEADLNDSVTIPVTVRMDNYEDATAQIVVTRTDKDTPVAVAQDITKTYDGKELKVSDIQATATFEGKKLSGTWSWVTDPATMVNAGTYTATVRFTPDDAVNYATATATLTVLVKQGKIVTPSANRDADTLDEAISADDFVDENGNRIPGTLTWYGEDGSRVSGNTEIDTDETYTWKFVPDDTTNYGTGMTGTYKPVNYKAIIVAAVIGGIAGGAGSSSFDDVASGDWYADAVSYVTREGLFEGVSENRFDPNGNMTRAMLVTVLWRMEGSPKTYSYADFKDVAHDTWYTEAVAWASKYGIVKGISDTEFAPNASITREQLAALLYRYADYKGVDTSASASLTAFTDGSKVSAYAKTAMEWAVTFGLLQGMSNNTLAPQGTATRAQVATMLMRFSQWFGL